MNIHLLLFIFLIKAEFVSFDLEFSGIKNDAYYFDLPNERYLKVIKFYFIYYIHLLIDFNLNN
jgi:hypothetical protein